MARPLRISFPGAFYHVTSRGNERKAVFKSRRDREQFLTYLETATERYDALIHTYCLMDNHYHLLLETPAGNLPQIMQHINGAYTTYFNVKRARSGHLFQGRYKAILVGKDAYAKELSRYVHLNPVRTGIVDIPEAYEWSSYNLYTGEKKAPLWLCRDFILAYFGASISAAQRGYKDFVQGLIHYEYDSPLAEVTGSLLLGSEDFISAIKTKFLQGRQPSNDLPPLRQLAPSVTVGTVFDEVDKEFGGDTALARDLKIHLCHKHSGEKLRSIGSRFGISDSAVSHASKRAKRRIETNEELRQKIQIIEKKLSSPRNEP